MSDLNLHSVNWQDGMLISQRHLKDQERYFENLARWYTLRYGDQYGLIRKSAAGKPALSLNSGVTGNRLRVEVVRCQAITPGGFYIEINESSGTSLRGECEITETIVPVFIGVDISTRKQTGNPDPAEDVPRIPYCAPAYLVALGQAPNLPEEQYVQVAELTVNGSEVALSDKYYPPCVTANADEKLNQKMMDFRNRLENLLMLSSKAYKAVATSGALAGSSTTLQVAFKDTVSFFVKNIAATLDDFVVGRNAPHPMQLVIQFKKLFRVLSSLLNLQPGLKDYLNEKFFNKEINSEVDRYLRSVDDFLLSEYDHRHIGGQVEMIDNLLNIYRAMLGFLAQTKVEQLGEQAVATETLTYNGRTYRNVAYGGTRLEQVGELSYLMIDVAKAQPVSDTVVLITKDLFGDAEWRGMQVRLGVNEARGLGETDPVDIDITAFSNKVALHPRDMLKSSSVRQFTLIFRGAGDPRKFAGLGKMDMIIYAV
nr:hypothetical protein [candidate division Zixibacteria bacterium]